MVSWKVFQQEKTAEFNNILDSVILNSGTVHNLRYCSAKVYDVCEYLILQSYRTIVAIYDRYTNELIVNGYYSATTQQHISKFIADFVCDSATRINCYLDSKNRVKYTIPFDSNPIRVDSKGYLYMNDLNGKKWYC